MIKKIKAISENKSILEYSAGLIAAIVILIIFVLAATYFKSVVFGLLLAFLFLPLQSWYQKHIISNKITIYSTWFIRTCLYPIVKPASILQKKLFSMAMLNKDNEKISAEEKIKNKQISKACHLTILTVFIIFLFFAGGIIWISTTYLTSATNSITTWAQRTTNDYVANKKILEEKSVNGDSLPNDEKEIINRGNLDPYHQFINALIFKFESIKPRLEQYKFFRMLKESVLKYLNNPENIKDLAKKLLIGTGGIFSYTAGAVGHIFVLFLNIVFTFFFFAFFLKKLANLNNMLIEKTLPSEYIANSIMGSAWFPRTSKGTIKITAEILENILYKLKIWLRGYCTIIIIESCFYTTVFTLIGVPFGIILGLFAGMTILLPYIGPMISVILTVTICLTVGNLSMFQILLVVLSYILMTGIIDQLFIYPAIVGGSLGLNEMETIIVVLLGGILAGISGMIFAVPVAAILKYLIPQTYKILAYEKELITKTLSSKEE
ncbi:MAG TPA: AI-2E family transporter [Victivallales bacterium]|nr:AI-2E family transporter [Victivallales bacterium]